MELKLFCIDDGEKHFIAHVSEEALREHAFEWYDIDPDDIEQIAEWPPDVEFTIHLTEGFDDAEDYPKEPYQNDDGQWMVTATVGEWLRMSKIGDMLASTVY